MATILVTGAAGFIGHHISLALLEQGHRVIGIDNFNPYYQVQLKQDRAARLAEAGITAMRELDICDYVGLLALHREFKFDLVCNLAAQAGVRYSLEHPFTYEKSNLEGFLAILELCRHGEIPRLVYASSSSVYGGNTKVPFSEEDPVEKPVSLYAATKRSNELMAHAYGHLYGLQTIGLRFFTVYGPWGRPDMAMWIFTKAMLAGKSIPVFNYGDMERDFTYIDDIVAGVVASLVTPDLPQHEIINLGNNRPEKLLDIIKMLGDALGVEPRMDLLPLQPGDVIRTYADIEKARSLFGFEPRTPTSVGIPNFVRWYRDYHHA